MRYDNFNKYAVILEPHHSEKATHKLDDENTLCFRVALSANKIGIWQSPFVKMTNIEQQETITSYNTMII